VIDFKALADHLASNAHDLLPVWLPGGKFDHNEYICSSLLGGSGSSFKYNIDKQTGKDFESGEAVGDMIDLYAQINGLSMGEAAKELNPAGLSRKPERQVITPVIKPMLQNITAVISKPPTDHIKPKFKHFKHGEPQSTWTYRDSSSEILFYIAKYIDADGKKQFSPWTWNGIKWTQKHWPAPRPLYGLELLGKKPVLIVEGEKAADAARKCIQPYTIVTWPGGSQAVGKSDFTPLYGRKILLWPDADEAGMTAMANIAELLLPNCPEIKVIDTSDLPDGFDAADFNGPSMLEFLRPRAKLIELPKPVVIVEPDEPPWPDQAPPHVTNNSLTVSAEDVESMTKAVFPANVVAMHERCGLDKNSAGHPYINTFNAMLVIGGLDELKESIWYDEFHKTVFYEEPGKPARPWRDSDDVNLCMLMQGKLQLRKMTKNIVNDAVISFAEAHPRNEPRDWMDKLEWDKIVRIDNFFPTAMLTPDSDYSRAVSRNFWLSMIARIYNPGCKVDNMVVLEGKQGNYKSTSLEIIGGKWYAKISASLDSKDFVQALNGKMLMEMDELDKFDRADNTTVKRILSTASDRYRPSYGRNTQDYPRTCIFAASTNETDYNRDPTGARRLWPIQTVKCDRDYIKANRDQLFAEAVARFKAGETWHEVPESAAQHQAERQDSDVWEDLILHHLTGKPYVSVSDILYYVLQINPGDQNKSHQMRVSNILKRHGMKGINGTVDLVRTRIWVHSDSLETTFKSIVHTPVQNFAPQFRMEV